MRTRPNLYDSSRSNIVQRACPLCGCQREVDFPTIRTVNRQVEGSHCTLPVKGYLLPLALVKIEIRKAQTTSAAEVREEIPVAHVDANTFHMPSLIRTQVYPVTARSV